MKAVVLAAGEGTRLRPFTASRPKGMLPVGNRPILDHIVRSLVKNNIKDIVMVVGYRRDTVLSYFEDGRRFGAKIKYISQEKQLGTAHALSLTEKEIGNEDFLVLAGDNLIDIHTVSDLLEKKNGPSMAVTLSEMPSKYGVVSVESGKISALVEKPQNAISNIINTGMYYFTPDFFKIFKNAVFSEERGITQVLGPNISRLGITAVKTTGKWIDAVYPWDLLNLNAAALELNGWEVSGVIEDGVTLRGPVVIGAGSRIRAGSYIEGPVNIGEGCTIGPNVVIQPSTSIGNGVQIDPFTYISNSLIMSNVRIGSHSHLSNSVIDDGVWAHAGLFASSSCAFARVDKELFRLNAIGALIGQDTSIGARVVICPGSIIGAGCKINDGVKVSGNLENRSAVV